MKKIAIVFNKDSGMTSRLDEVKVFCDSLPPKKFDIELKEVGQEEDLNTVVKKLVKEKYDIIVAAGGDGTVNAVASNLLETDIILGVLPLGTLNHLAKDLKIPLDLTEALRLITGDHDVIKIDVGECNGNIFLNNSGLGIYPRIVELREKFQKNGHLKWLAFIFALFHVYGNIPKHFLKLKIGDDTLEKKTSFVFVGNNIYGLGGLATGTRGSLSDGKLSVWISHRSTAFGLIRLFLHAVFGNVKEHRDFDVFEGEKMLVQTKRKQCLVSFDGEITQVESPLRYKIRPTSLCVIAPIPLDETA